MLASVSLATKLNSLEELLPLGYKFGTWQFLEARLLILFFLMEILVENKRSTEQNRQQIPFG